MDKTGKLTRRKYIMSSKYQFKGKQIRYRKKMKNDKSGPQMPQPLISDFRKDKGT